MMRGSSVRDRASQYEQGWQASPYGPSPSHLHTPNRPYQNGQSASPTPNFQRDDNPYKAAAHAGPSFPRTATMYGSEYNSPSTHTLQGGVQRLPTSAKKMIAKWEGSTTSTGGPSGFLAANGMLQPPRGNTPPTQQQIDREYLNQKPLPSPDTFTPPYAGQGGSTSPQHTPPGQSRLPGNSPLRNGWAPPSPAPQFRQTPQRPPVSPIRGQVQASPSKVSFAPSATTYLQTPNRGRSGSVDGSPPNWSGSPNEKKRKGNGKSPLKEMFTAIGKRAKGKGKEKKDSYGSGGYDITLGAGLQRVGSNGLPGGIVFRDRMGDREMDQMEIDQAEDRSTVRYSPCLFLVPTPCSSDSPWGAWLTSWAVLTNSALRITFSPIFQEPQNQGSPRRMLDPQSAIPYHIIPSTDPNQKPDTELDMSDCVEVRSLRREEIGGRSVPVPPDGVGTEVLEMVWSDGSKRYIGVEGVSGRISWISAIWDVLLACKSEGQALLPPPSPTHTPRPLPWGQQRDNLPSSSARPIDEPSPFRTKLADPGPTGLSPSRLYDRRESIDGPVAHGAAPPVQKVGDRWVAASVVGKGGSEVSENTRSRTTKPDALHNSVKRMFDGPADVPPGQERTRLYMATADGIREYDDESDGGDETIMPPDLKSPSINGAPIRFDSDATIGMGTKSGREATERILAWQPATERELSIFARSPSRASSKSQSRRKVLSDSDRDNTFKTAESHDTEVSFDPSDLNPSRSASQAGRPKEKETPRRRGSKATPLPPVDENTPPGRPAQQETYFSPMAEKAFRRMSRTDYTDEKPPRTPTKTPRDLRSPKAADIGLSPLAERAYRQLAGKSLDDQRPASPLSPKTSRQVEKSPMRSRDDRHVALPRGVEVFSTETHSSETMESATIRTPQTEHNHGNRQSPQMRRDSDGDVPMGEPNEPERGSGGALSKLLPAYSDLSHSEVGVGTLDDKLSVAGTNVTLASKDLQRVILALTTLVGASKALEDPATLPKGLDDRFNTIHLDVKAIENALSLSGLRLPGSTPTKEDDKFDPDLPEVHAKLDAIQKMCEDVLARQEELKASESDKSVKAPAKPRQFGLGLTLNDDEKSASDEVSQIMANLTGTSANGTSPRRVGLQVLHNISAPTSPRIGGDTASIMNQEPLSDDVRKQVVEVLALVKELKEARTLQTQQTTDIARYLNELNVWLEKFVQNSAVELSSMSKRLNTLVGPKDESDDPDNPREPTAPLPELVAEMHNMLAEQRKRTDDEGPVGQRLDGLLQMMGQDRERQAGQQGMVEQVLTILGRQRNDNEMLLRALANDLTSEIRGERIRFVEAMQQATSMNVTRHVEEFKKTLSTEVQKSIKELSKVREEKRALEHQIADLFALKAKFGGNSRRASVDPPAGQGVNLIQAMAAAVNPYGGGPGMGGMPGMAGPGGRVLPAPPG